MSDQELATTPAPLAVIEPTPMQVIQEAIASKVPPEVLRELMALKRDMEADDAAKAYSDAIVNFQAKCPTIHKGRKVPGMGSFAAYEDIKKVIQPFLTEFGITLSYSFGFGDGHIMATCTVTVGAHSRSSTAPVAIPKSMGQINDSQKSGVAMSYAKRYSMGAALDLVMTDEDTDANGLGETITEKEAVILGDMLQPLGSAQLARLLEWAGVDKLADMPASKHAEAVDGIKRRLKGIGQ